MTLVEEIHLPQRSNMTHRILSTLAIGALMLAAAQAGTPARAEPPPMSTAISPAFSPNTGGTLMLSDEKAMYFRTGLANVPVPYANITHVELGATKETSHDVPAYKVWKHFEKKTQTQLLIVNFKSDEGEEKNMTLELAKPAAAGVMSAIQSHAPQGAETTAVAKTEPTPSEKPAKNDSKVAKADKKDVKKDSKPEEKEADKTFASRAEKPGATWWGDDYWKTSRNADKWGPVKPATPPTPPATNEQNQNQK